jgi:hypothetical protein
MDKGPVYACPSCGAIYEKVEKAINAQSSAAANQKSTETTQVVVRPKQRTAALDSPKSAKPWSPRKRALASVGSGFALLTVLSMATGNPAPILLSPLLYFLYKKFNAPFESDRLSTYLNLALTKEPGFQITKSLLGLEGKSGILLDEGKRKIMIVEQSGAKFGVYNESDILSCEVVEDGSVVSSTSTGVGKAALGGLAFGAVGLVAGALVGTKESRTKTEISEIFLLLKTNQRSYPIHRIELFNSSKPISRSEPAVKSALRVAEDANALIELIIQPAA